MSVVQTSREMGVSITIQRPAQEIFDRWIAVAHVPKFVGQVIIVRREGDNGFAWKATVTDTGRFEESRPVASVESALNGGLRGHALQPPPGSLMLLELPHERGTEMRVMPDGAPSRDTEKSRDALKEELRLELMRFRQMLEAGEIATVRGQPSGRKNGLDAKGSDDEQRSMSGRTRA